VSLQALVFDFDGLILETEGRRYHAWREVFSEHGLVLTVEDLAADIGTFGTIDPLRLLEDRLGRPVDDADGVRARKNGRENELLLAETVMPGVVELLDAAHAAGLGTAVASSSPRSWVVGNLDRLGLVDAFVGLACFDDVGVAKPDPAVYRRACELLGVRPDDAVAFEDSLHGVRAARTAGLRCVAVPTPMTEHMAFDEADLVVRSLAEVTLADLFSRFGGAAIRPEPPGGSGTARVP
jgi:HAD superfamily hydrolase (TIGR01509 family)